LADEEPDERAWPTRHSGLEGFGRLLLDREVRQGGGQPRVQRSHDDDGRSVIGPSRDVRRDLLEIARDAVCFRLVRGLRVFLVGHSGSFSVEIGDVGE